MNADMTMNKYDLFLPAPAELSEHELEAVAGGATPTTLATPWVWAGAVGAAAGALAAVVELVNHIEDKQLGRK